MVLKNVYNIFCDNESIKWTNLSSEKMNKFISSIIGLDFPIYGI